MNPRFWFWFDKCSDLGAGVRSIIRQGISFTDMIADYAHSHPELADVRKIIERHIPAALYATATAFSDATDLQDKGRKANIKALQQLNRMMPGIFLHDPVIRSELEKQTGLAAHGGDATDLQDRTARMKAAQDWLLKTASPTQDADRPIVSEEALRMAFQYIYHDVIFFRALYDHISVKADDLNVLKDTVKLILEAFPTLAESIGNELVNAIFAPITKRDRPIDVAAAIYNHIRGAAGGVDMHRVMQIPGWKQTRTTIEKLAKQQAEITASAIIPSRRQ